LDVSTGDGIIRAEPKRRRVAAVQSQALPDERQDSADVYTVWKDKISAVAFSSWTLDILPPCGIPLCGTGYWILSSQIEYWKIIFIKKVHYHPIGN